MFRNDGLIWQQFNLEHKMITLQNAPENITLWNHIYLKSEPCDPKMYDVDEHRS